jgi:hypothetical protein
VKTYLVGVSESEFAEGEFMLITAPSPDEAETLFLRGFIPTDTSFLEFVGDTTVNMSFAEHFWFQTPEEDAAFQSSGAVLIDQEEFERRVRVFFGEQHDYAAHYINHHRGDGEWGDESPGLPFPLEMLTYIAAQLNYYGLVAIPLDNIKAVSHTTD